MGWTSPPKSAADLAGLTLSDLDARHARLANTIEIVSKITPKSAYDDIRMLACAIRDVHPEMTEHDAVVLLLAQLPKLYDRYSAESAAGRYGLTADGTTPVVYDEARPDATTPVFQRVPNGVDVVARVERMAASLMQNDPTLSLADAYRKVFLDATLYAAYNAAVAVTRDTP